MNTAVNIGADGAKVRVLAGVLLAFFSFFLLVLLVGLGAERWLRLLLLPPSWGALLCFLQARARVSVFHARRGQRDMGLGREPVADVDERRGLEERARRLLLVSLAGAVVCTVLGALVPPLQRVPFG